MSDVKDYGMFSKDGNEAMKNAIDDIIKSLHSLPLGYRTFVHYLALENLEAVREVYPEAFDTAVMEEAVAEIEERFEEEFGFDIDLRV